LCSPAFAAAMILSAMACLTSSAQSQSDAGQFKGDAQNTYRLGIEVLAVEEWSDWHGCTPLPFTGGSAIGLSVTGAWLSFAPDNLATLLRKNAFHKPTMDNKQALALS
jgi:hypothetical protein